MRDFLKINEEAVGRVCAQIEVVQDNTFHFGVRPSVLTRGTKMGFTGDRWFLEMPNRDLACIHDGNCVVDAVTTAAALERIPGAWVTIREYELYGALGNSEYGRTHFRTRIQWGGVIDEEVDHSRFYRHFFRSGLVWGSGVDEQELIKAVKPDGGEHVYFGLWGLPYAEFPVGNSWGLVVASVVSAKRDMEVHMGIVMPDQPKGAADFTAVLPVPFGAVHHDELKNMVEEGDFWLLTGLHGGRDERERVVLHEMGRQLFPYSILPDLRQWIAEIVDILPSYSLPIMAGEE